MSLSVRFFKRLFLCLLLLAILVPIGLAVYFGVCFRDTKTVNEALYVQLAAAEEKLAAAQEQDAQGPAEDARPSPAAYDETSFDYQQLYPELVCQPQRPNGWVRNTDTVYLTFDDGPSDNTAAILDILADYDVKATFFVTGKTDETSLALMRRIVEQGHTIGVHTYSHQYRQIYRSIEDYLTDFKQVYDLIYDATGVNAEVFRFAGGSINGYNVLLYQPLIAEMTRRGFTYFDWNVTGGDTAKNADVSNILKNVFHYIEGQTRAIILLHDGTGHEATVEALPNIISGLREKGYSFAALTPEIAPIIFSYDT